MERKVKREQNLPSFSIDIPQLELLISKIKAEFNDESVSMLITIELPSKETFKIRNTEELKDFAALPELPDNIKNFNLLMYTQDESVTISSNFKAEYNVSASSGNEAWCAGIVEIVNSTAILNKRFYSPVNKLDSFWTIYIFIFTIVLVALINTLTNFIPTEITFNIYNVIGFLFVICLMFYIKHNLFPPFVLRINDSDNIIKRYSPQIMTISTVVIAVGTAVMAVS